jgi:phenylalanyl-tRNA synthetase beta chain
MKLLESGGDEMRYRPIPRYPAVDRDIALVVDHEVSARELEAVIRETGGELLTRADVFDLYEGEHVEAGKKSVAFSLRYLNTEKTLTEEEVTLVHSQVLKALEEKTGAVLRAQ